MNSAKKENTGLLTGLSMLTLNFLDSVRKFLMTRSMDGICNSNTMEEIHITNQHIRNHIENSPLAMIEWDSNFRITKWSDQAEKLFGWKAAELAGKGPWDFRFIHEDDIERIKLFMIPMMNGKELRNNNINKNYTKDGETVHCAWYNSALLDSKGKLISVMSLANDITSQINTENQLKESELKYRTLVEITGEALFINQDDRIIYLNPAALKLFGAGKAEEIIGRSPFDFFQVEYHELIRERINKLYNGMDVPVVEYRLIARDGRISYVEVTTTLFQYNGRNALQVVMRDITERKIADSDSRQNQMLVQIAGELANLGGYKVDLITQTITWSEQVAVMHEVSPGFSPTMEQAVNFYVPEHHEDVLEAIGRCAVEGIVIDQELEIITARGNRKWVKIIGVPERDDSGKIVSIIGGIQDISDRKAIEENLTRALEKAEHSDNLKTAFLNNLSHEIRTPLNAIVGFSALISEPGQSAEQFNYLAGIIQNSSDQLLSIIDDIINISMIQTGQIEVHERETDVIQLVDKVFHRYSAGAELKNVAIVNSNELDPDNSMILTDGSKLTHVLSHLIDNAIKFTDRGRIEIRSSIIDDQLQLCVSDTGIGIDTSLGDRIYERFYQCESEISKKRGGLGMGLPISRAFIESMGGKFWYESAIGTGTSFYLRVPWKPVVRQDKPELRRNFSHNVKKRVLVAEDELSNFNLIQEVLVGMDVTIVHAWNGKQAVELVKQYSDIELVLMDIKMPLMGGHEATGIIKSLKPDLPIIALTAHAIQGDRELALDAGCDDYLSKPYSITTLISFVEKYLGIKSGVAV
ncbi:MAG: PAS domain S-box protein [Bacteroidales bacterium]